MLGLVPLSHGHKVLTERKAFFSQGEKNAYMGYRSQLSPLWYFYGALKVWIDCKDLLRRLCGRRSSSGGQSPPPGFEGVR